MKPLDCDQVFDVLTRGPFPSGDASDGPVEKHLRCCHECRTLAEALRPAVELFHEAIDADEGRDLPGYHGTLEYRDSADGPQRGVAQLVMAAIAAETAVAPERFAAPRSSWWESLAVDRYRLAGAVAIGALFAFVFWGLSAGESSAPMARSTRAARYSPTDQGMLTLANLRLPASCLSAPDELSSAAHAWHCCTECHSAPHTSTTSHSPTMLLAVVQSCRACHP